MSPDEKALRADLESGRFLAGEARMRWRLASIDWPHVQIGIMAKDEQEFVLRFGRTDNPDAPQLTVSTTSAGRGLTTTSVTKPATQYQVTVTATAVVTTADGERVFSGSRSATAQYVSVGQVLADTEASNEAAERAAKEAAEGLRLAVLGALATPVAGQ